MATKRKKSGSKESLEPSKPNFWTSRWVPALILLLIPLLLYAASYRFGYVLDDKLVLSENKFVQSGTKGIRDIFAHESLTGFLGRQSDYLAGARYRPLSLATFAIEHQVFGEKPGISHLINALLYGLTALVIYRLMFLLQKSPSDRPWYLQLPFVVALLFTLHPLHTEVVANIKGRDEILALLLALASSYYFLQALDSGKTWKGWLGGGLFLLAIFAKENAITFLAVIPLMAYAFSKPDLKRLAGQMLPFGVATGFYLLVRYAVIGFLMDGGQEIVNLMNNPFLNATAGQKSATISLTMAWYLKLLVVPYPLTHDYYPYHVPLVGWGDWRAILGLAASLGLLGVAALTWKKEKIVSFSILYYFITLSLVANIFFPVGTFMNERFLYMPSVGFCLLVAWLFCVKMPAWWAAKPQLAKTAVTIGLGGMATLFAIITFTRVPDWENTLTLHTASIEVSSESAFSNQNYAFALYQESDKTQDPLLKRRLLDKAMPYVNKSLEIYPDYFEALGTKTGMMVGYFQMDNRIEPLLTWFEYVQKHHPIDYIDGVLKDLIAFGQHRIELNYFLQEVGYNHFWVAMGDKPRASRYLQMLKSIDPNNPNVDLAIQNIQNGKR